MQNLWWMEIWIEVSAQCYYPLDMTDTQCHHCVMQFWIASNGFEICSNGLSGYRTVFGSKTFCIQDDQVQMTFLMQIRRARDSITKRKINTIDSNTLSECCALLTGFFKVLKTACFFFWISGWLSIWLKRLYYFFLILLFWLLPSRLHH